MKKKKLKQRITKLESQLVTAKLRTESWEDISHRFIEKLMEYGVKTEIKFPELPVIEVSSEEDDVAKYAFGINTEPPILLFDFSEHDKKVVYDFKRKTEEDNEPEEIKQCRDFLKRENKCYIYISDFFARPMGYESLGFSCAYKEVPIVKIKYSNGMENEVAITELMKYDTLEKCEKQCEVINEEMKECREKWSRDYWGLRNITMENMEND